MLKMYCVKCRTKTDNDKPTPVKAKNGRIMLKGKCNSCGTMKSQFISKDAAQSGGFLPFLLPALGGLLLGKSMSG